MKATIYEFINEMSEAELRRAARVASDEYFNEECTRENLAVNMLRWVLEAELNAGTLTKQEIIAATEIPNPDNTPSTMNANETTEFSELTHAGQCLDIYLHNTKDIYNRYTVPAINAVVETVRRSGWQLPKEEAIKNLTFWTSWQDGTKKALQAAARLVKRCDGMTPTAKDIEQVTRNYAAYIVDCAKYEIEK